MTVSVESAAARRGTGRGNRTAATPSRITASGARTATASRRRSGPRRSSPHSASAATHVTRNAIARSKLKNVSASSTFETGASRVYSVGRTRSTSAGGAPLTASTRPGKGERDEREGDRVATQQIHSYNLGYESSGRYSHTPARVLPRRRCTRLPRGA